MAEEKKKPTPKKKETKPQTAADAPVEKTGSKPVEKAAAKPDEKAAVKSAEEKSAKKGAPGAEAPVAETPKPAETAVIPAAPTAAELLGEDIAAKKVIKAKHAKNISVGIANILATFNNTQVSITDAHGNLIGWSTAGRVGFKGSRKSTAYAAQQVAQDAARRSAPSSLDNAITCIIEPGLAPISAESRSQRCTTRR